MSERSGLSRPVVAVGMVMILVGLVLLAPSALVGFRFRVVHGEVQEVFPVPIADGRVRIELAYTYPIGPGELDGYPDGATAFGHRSCSWLGTPREDPVLDAEAATDLLARLEPHRRGRPFLVYYDPEDPIASARAPLISGTWIARASLLGLLFILAPVATWSLLLVARWFSRRHRTASVRAR